MRFFPDRPSRDSAGSPPGALAVCLASQAVRADTVRVTVRALQRRHRAVLREDGARHRAGQPGHHHQDRGRQLGQPCSREAADRYFRRRQCRPGDRRHALAAGLRARRADRAARRRHERGRFATASSASLLAPGEVGGKLYGLPSAGSARARCVLQQDPARESRFIRTDRPVGTTWWAAARKLKAQGIAGFGSLRGKGDRDRRVFLLRALVVRRRRWSARTARRPFNGPPPASRPPSSTAR